MKETKPEKRKEHEMPENKKKTTQPTAAEKALEICQQARQRLSETRAALMEATKAAREAIREEKQRESEIKDVRRGLERIRQIKV